MIRDDIERAHYQASKLKLKQELGRRISEDFKGKDIVLVGILKGAVVFMADLMREIDAHVDIDFMEVSSYGSSTKSSGR